MNPIPTISLPVALMLSAPEVGRPADPGAERDVVIVATPKPGGETTLVDLAGDSDGLSECRRETDGPQRLESGPQAGERVTGFFDFAGVKCGGAKDRYAVGTAPRYY